MRIVPFEADHLRRLEGREIERRMLATVGDLGAYAGAFALPGLAFTGLGPDDTVIACAGVLPLWPGVGQAWALMSVHAPGAFKAVHRGVAGFLDDAFSAGRFHRVQMSVAAEFPAAARWAEHLGFAHEGLMRAYGPDGSDHFLYARTR